MRRGCFSAAIKGGSVGISYNGNHREGVTSRSEVAGFSGIPNIVIECGLQAVSVCVGVSVAFDWGTCVCCFLLEI